MEQDGTGWDEASQVKVLVSYCSWGFESLRPHQPWFTTSRVDVDDGRRHRTKIRPDHTRRLTRIRQDHARPRNNSSCRVGPDGPGHIPVMRSYQPDARNVDARRRAPER